MKSRLKIPFALALAVLASAGMACAENAGYIKSLGVITGSDGKKYMKVEHSATGNKFGSGDNRLWGMFFVPWGDDDFANTIKYSDLQKSLSNHSVTVDATNGYTTDKIDGGWVPVVTDWLLRSP